MNKQKLKPEKKQTNKNKKHYLLAPLSVNEFLEA